MKSSKHPEQDACFTKILASADAQATQIPRLSEAGVLPTFDSIEQCASACRIPVKVLKAAKRAGCPAFRSTRVFLGEFLAWHFEHAVRDSDGEIDLRSEKARLTRAEADLAEMKLREERERLVALVEVEHRISERVVLPLSRWLNDLPHTCAVRCNTEHPEQARVALNQARDDCKKLLRAALVGKKSNQHHAPRTLENP